MSTLVTYVIQTLQQVYPLAEARAVSRRLLEDASLGLSVSQQFAGKVSDLSESQQTILQNYLQRLLAREPLQYVLGYAWFCGQKLKVGPGVLIPRPETEDLVDWICADWADYPSPRILDACTGSGCIAVALAQRIPSAQVQAIDLSPDALAYARENAQPFFHRVSVSLGDVFAPQTKNLPHLQVLVSNPPYVTECEQDEMTAQVKDFEPAMALFVPDNDPLRYYRALAQRGLRELQLQGALYVEINQKYGREVQQLFETYGYRDVEIRADRFGRPRMVKGVRV